MTPTISVPGADPSITAEDRAAVLSVLDSGVLANGPATARLEAAFARFCSSSYCAAVSNGTAALTLAGSALGLSIGTTVLVPGFSFAATANAFLQIGCNVVPVDIDPVTFNMDSDDLNKALRERPAPGAIVVVDLFGSARGTDGVFAIAGKNGIPIIEDAAQAHGATSGAGERIGRRAALTTFSLYATKNITGGEGGLITTDSETFDHQLRLLRSHGSLETYHHEITGANFRITEMAAALAHSQLARLTDLNRKRQEIARQLSVWCHRYFADRVIVPEIGEDHVFHQFTIRFRARPDRDQVQCHLRRRGVDARVFYPYLIGDLPRVMRRETPMASRCRDEVLSLPVHPTLSTGQLEILRTALASAATDLAG